jgi:hypothetical protein
VLDSPVFRLASLAFTLTAIVLAYIFYRKAHRVKEPCWAIRSNNLVNQYTAKLPDLDIHYKGDPVADLSISRIMLWNHGRETVKEGDIAPADALRVEAVGDTTLLDVKILQTNSPASRFSAELMPDGKSAILRFDFVDHRQGSVIEVVHSGTSSGDLQIAGTIVGFGTPRKKNIKVVEYLPLPTSKEFDRKVSPKIRRLVFYITPAILFILLLVLLGAAFFIVDFDFGWFEWAGLIYAAVGIAFIMAMYLRGGSVPRGLESFEGDL